MKISLKSSLRWVLPSAAWKTDKNTGKDEISWISSFFVQKIGRGIMPRPKKEERNKEEHRH